MVISKDKDATVAESDSEAAEQAVAVLESAAAVLLDNTHEGIA